MQVQVQINDNIVYLETIDIYKLWVNFISMYIGWAIFLKLFAYFLNIWMEKGIHESDIHKMWPLLLKIRHKRAMKCFKMEIHSAAT